MFIDQDDPEWRVMWDALRVLEGETTRINPESGECWQYMGTWMPEDVAVHSFRHRDHPRTLSRECLAIPCSAEYLARVTIEPFDKPGDEDIPF